MSLKNIITKNCYKSVKNCKNCKKTKSDGYVEFLPTQNKIHRDSLCEKIERRDMIMRRSVIKVPTFYVGVEIMYDMYNPCIQQIDVIKLEKRLDGHLLYLRDADLSYSYFPEDMKPVFLSPDAPVPVNPLKVTLKSTPWTSYWEIYGLKGITPLTMTPRMDKRVKKNRNVWSEFDLMDKYRESIPLDEQIEIYQDILRLEADYPPKGVVLDLKDVRKYSKWE
ncbi:39S ribosomal protein L19, mitochondrial-like [Octopus sinensis]|uniref:39S ribosomal protein L19, mitochondrial-like n=1 Tax=Octopus sinensis TaxID=2607531 RepID=A0A6P7U0G9_9MOLL|nr:39S ribosomal protein L19, mitochondrial-like [Octopus sinensis]